MTAETSAPSRTCSLRARQPLNTLAKALGKRTTTSGSRSDALTQLDAEAEAIATTILARFRSASPEYAALPDEALLPGIEQNVHRAIAAIDEQRGPTRSEVRETEALAELRARQGVGVDALLVAYRLGVEAAWERFVVLARERGVGAEELLAASEGLRHWADELMVVIARAHRRVDVELARRDHERRSGFVRALLAALSTAQGCAAARSPTVST